MGPIHDLRDWPLSREATTCYMCRRGHSSGGPIPGFVIRGLAPFQRRRSPLGPPDGIWTRVSGL
jgi:hypothetical protein